MSELTLTSDTPWDQPWPVSELEAVTACPICGNAARTALQENLIDKVFYVAQGKWTLWKCSSCSSAYLDPRPSLDTIHRAYSGYYTHQEIARKVNYESLGLLRKLRRRLLNGYTNWRYGTCVATSSALGIPIILAMRSTKKSIDREYRHLPRKPAGGGVVLDVGFGDGSFLDLARSCGWDVVGLDVDPTAVANAAKRGLSVYQGGIEYFDGKAELFDVITLSHVIEHVFDPLDVLKACYTVLKPDGQLWLETPNIESFGYKYFQKNWLSLDSPRHLTLFNRRSLNQLFVNAGFNPPLDRARQSATNNVFKSSYAINKSIPPFDKVANELAMPVALRVRAKLVSFLEVIFPSRREFLTVTANKVAR